MKSDGDALLRVILENPDDDTARLVYSDWLEESATGVDSVCWKCNGGGRAFRPWNFGTAADNVRDFRICPACAGVGSLADEKTLLADLIRMQIAFPEDPATASRLLLAIYRGCIYGYTARVGTGDVSGVYFERGFAHRIVATSADIWTLSKQVFAEHPVTSVRRCDWLPTLSYTGMYEVIAGFELYNNPLHLESPTVEGIYEEDSKATVEYFRAKNGLPDLFHK